MVSDGGGGGWGCDVGLLAALWVSTNKASLSFGWTSDGILWCFCVISITQYLLKTVIFEGNYQLFELKIRLTQRQNVDKVRKMTFLPRISLHIV